MPRLRLPDALPPLRGRFAAVYVAYWVVILALAIVGPVGNTVRLARQPIDPLTSLGLSWDGDDRRATVATVLSDEARAYDVRVGDAIVAVDGADIAARGGPQAVPPGAEGQRAAVTLRRAGEPRTVALTYRRANVDRLYAGSGLTAQSERYVSAAPFLLATVFMIFAAVLLFRRRRDPVAALLSLGIAGSAVTSGNTYAFWTATGWIEVVSVILAPANFALFLGLLVFPSGRFEPRWTKGIVLLPALLVLLRSSPDDPLGPPLLLMVALCILSVLVWRYIRDRRSDAARQWRWAVLGLVAGVVLATMFMTVLQPWVIEASHHNRVVSVWQMTIIATIYALSMICMFGGLVLSVLRYRLYDTQAAVSRSVLYGVLTIALLAIFAGSEKIVEVLGEQYFGESMGALAGGLGAAFAAVALGPLHHRVSHWVQHRFRKDLLHLGRDLPPLLAELSETADPRTVAQAALDRIAHALHAIRGAIVDRGAVVATSGGVADVVTRSDPGAVGEVILRRNDVDLPVRMRLAADGASWLLLGPRPDGSTFDAQERDLLADVARPLAQALHVSENRTAHAAAITARLDRIEQALATLDDLVRTPGAAPARAG